MIDWIDWTDATPLSLEDRDNFAKEVLVAIHKAQLPTSKWSALASGDSMVFAWERSDGTIEIVDAKIVRHAILGAEERGLIQAIRYA